MKTQHKKTTIYFTKMPSPVGELTLVASDTHLLAILWEHEKNNRVRLAANPIEKTNGVLKEAAQQLKEYFAGQRKTFDLPLGPKGTEFQEKVWMGLRKIPYGKTWSYKDLAKKIGSEKAVRAVGAANGKNPLSIVIPCHRVIGADGSLTGFAGGLETKTYLLHLESHTQQES
jgi:methylated-DNA-[protein]-cysteine S-methyltransferase